MQTQAKSEPSGSAIEKESSGGKGKDLPQKSSGKTGGGKVTLTERQQMSLAALENEAHSQGSPAIPLTVGIGAGLGAIAFGFPPIAIGAVAAPFIFRSILKALENGRVDEFIEAEGIFVHRLDKKKMAQFVYVFGEEQGCKILASHLVRARAEGQPLTKAAHSFLDLLTDVPEEVTLEAIASRVNAAKKPQLGPAEMNMILDAVDEIEAEESRAPSGYWDEDEADDDDESQTEENPPIEVEQDSARDFVLRLKTECYPLYKLIQAPPIRIVGRQRTGKTTLAKLLCLSRMIAMQGHKVHAITPHFEGGNPYPRMFRIYGFDPVQRIRKGQEIADQWFKYADRNKKNAIANLTTIWDEFGSYADFIEEEDLSGNLASMLREASKRKEFPIFLVHGETARFLPGAKGMVTVFNEGTVRVETFGALVEDDMGLEVMRPTGQFSVDFGDGEILTGQVPSWLTEEYLLKILSGNGVEAPSETGSKPVAAPSPSALPSQPTSPYGLVTGLPKDVMKAWTLGAKQKELLRKYWGLTDSQIDSHCDEFQSARDQMRSFFMGEAECDMSQGFVTFKMYCDQMPKWLG